MSFNVHEKNKQTNKMQSPFISTLTMQKLNYLHTQLGHSLNIYIFIHICGYSNALNAHMKQRKSIAEKIYLIKFY